MRTSFPILRGKALSSISHGTYTLVVERARHTYLTVVLEGEETDQLRRQMRDLLLDFETTNRAVLAQWRGLPESSQGTDQPLSRRSSRAPPLRACTPVRPSGVSRERNLAPIRLQTRVL